MSFCYFNQVTKQLAGSEDLDGRYKRSRLYREIRSGFRTPMTSRILEAHRRCTNSVAVAEGDAKLTAEAVDNFNAIVRSYKQPPKRFPGSPRN